MSQLGSANGREVKPVEIFREEINKNVSLIVARCVNLAERKSTNVKFFDCLLRTDVDAHLESSPASAIFWRRSSSFHIRAPVFNRDVSCGSVTSVGYVYSYGPIKWRIGRIGHVADVGEIQEGTVPDSASTVRFFQGTILQRADENDGNREYGVPYCRVGKSPRIFILSAFLLFSSTTLTSFVVRPFAQPQNPARLVDAIPQCRFSSIPYSIFRKIHASRLPFRRAEYGAPMLRTQQAARAGALRPWSNI